MPIAILTIAVAAISAAPAAAKGSCGTERVLPGTISPPKTGSTTPEAFAIPYKIIVWRGKVSCRKARSLIKATGEGKGTWHEAPDIAAIYTTLPGGWRCALATGGITAACGADASGLPDTRMKSMGYSSSRWLRAWQRVHPFLQ